MRPLKTPEDIENCKILKESWRAPGVPQKQYEAIWQERAYLANGEYYKIAPYNTFIEACKTIDQRELGVEMDILDAGASSAYYSQVLQQGGFGSWGYTAMDYSPAFKDMAKKLYPWVHFDLGDMTDFPYADKTFKIVTINITNLHIEDWQKALDETFRVARFYVIIHRIPLWDYPTSMFEEEAYGVKIIHTMYNREDFARYIASKTKSYWSKYIPVYDTNQFTVVVEKR